MTVERPSDVQPASFFLLRTPLLPIETLLSLSDGLRAAHDESAYATDRRLLRERLREIVSQPEVAEALYVASPDLHDSLGVWHDAPEGERGQAVEGALARYVARMAGRATPFGLFGGCSVGSIGHGTRLVLAAQSAYRRHSRLDMEYLSSLSASLASEPGTRASLRFQPNSSAYPLAGQVRLVEQRWTARGRSYDLVAVEDTTELAATLARARGGASLAELAESLIGEDISYDDAFDYVEQLVASQLLVAPDLEPRITGPEATNALIDAIRDVPSARDVAATLDQVQSGLRALDRLPPGAPASRYAELATRLEGLPGRVERNRLFQVDLVKPARTATIDASIADEILRAVELLRQVGGAGGRRGQRLTQFRDALYERYGERKVPLVEALDEDLGIGFSSRPMAESAPLLAGLHGGQSPATQSSSWGSREAHLLQRLLRALTEGATEILLDDADVAAMAAADALPLPDSFAVMASLATPPDSDEFRVLIKGVNGPSGVALLGRFCHADPDLEAGVRELVAAEESLHPDAIFAEIVHLPEGRMGNVLSRPVLRDYEIVYLGGSGAAEDRQLTVTDLLVGVENNRLVLYSERLQRRVIPRLSSAHNYDLQSLSAYAFLGALQEEGVASMPGWTWGPLSTVPFLPRVTSGRTVLARARWNLTGAEVAPLLRGTASQRFAAVQRWRAERKLPRFVSLADGDNELSIDLDNALSVEALLHGLKQGDGGALVEQFASLGEQCVSGPEGRFVNELIVPFVRSGARPAPVVTPPARSAVRTFAPGSEWLYAKLYTGAPSADRLLRDYVQPLTEHVLRSGAADSWFFLRYTDPEFHVRLRFHGDPERLSGEVLPALQAITQRALEDGLVWRLQLDTYEREIERYGGEHGIGLAEAIFHADSQAAQAIITATPGDAGYAARWRAALQGMDGLLDSLGFGLLAKRDLARRQRELLGREFGSEATLRSLLGERFRAQRAMIETIDVERPDDAARAALAQRSATLAALPHIASAAPFAPSLLHMHVNRVMRSAPNAHELVLYEFLARVYQSRLARAGSGA